MPAETLECQHAQVENSGQCRGGTRRFCHQATGDFSVEVECLLSLGAERVAWHRYPEDPDFVVLADSDGNRFCIVDLSHEDR